MSADKDDEFFSRIAYDDKEVPETLERDQWRRPLIIPPEGGEPVAYTRASSLAGYIENKAGLHKWDVRQVVRGMGLREDVAAMAAALPDLTDNKRLDAPTNTALDEYAELARDAAGEHAKANWGTAVHGLTMPGREGDEAVPQRMQADIESYWAMLERFGIRTVASEVFVVNDRLKSAGTFDHLYEIPGHGLVVGDKKTGKVNMHSTAVQLAVYDGSVVYDPLTGERTPLRELAGPTAVMPHACALYVHIPKGEGRTELFWVDMDLGREAADHAAWVRDYKGRKDMVHRAEAMLDTFVAVKELHAATTRAELSAIYARYKHVWTGRLTEIGKQSILKG